MFWNLVFGNWCLGIVVWGLGLMVHGCTHHIGGGQRERGRKREQVRERTREKKRERERERGRERDQGGGGGLPGGSGRRHRSRGAWRPPAAASSAPVSGLKLRDSADLGFGVRVHDLGLELILFWCCRDAVEVRSGGL